MEGSINISSTLIWYHWPLTGSKSVLLLLNPFVIVIVIVIFTYICKYNCLHFCALWLLYQLLKIIERFFPTMILHLYPMVVITYEYINNYAILAISTQIILSLQRCLLRCCHTDTTSYGSIPIDTTVHFKYFQFYLCFWLNTHKNIILLCLL